MRKVLILGHLQNLSERKTDQHHPDLHLSVFGICLDKVSKVALSLIFSVSSFGFKIHESVFFFDGIVKSLKCIALFLWGRILHVNVNIFCSHVNRQNGCTYSLHFSKISLHKCLYP